METVVKATCLYWLLLTVLRMIGRRAVSQLTPFEADCHVSLRWPGGSSYRYR
jgi:uncharacterized membrane protein YcaP (DUF421 family)